LADSRRQQIVALATGDFCGSYKRRNAWQPRVRFHLRPLIIQAYENFFVLVQYRADTMTIV